MKKIITVLAFVLIAVMAVTACSPAAAPSAAPAASEAAAAPAESAAAPAATEAPAEPAPAESAAAPAESESAAAAAPAGGAKTIGFYADAADSYYKVINDVLVAALAADPETADWKVEFKVGQGSADEQLKAVEDFITAGYDAIAVIQNNPNTTSECITKCVDAGIPYFGVAHMFGQVPNAADAAGSIGHNFVQAGRYAGEDAVKRGISKVIMIEGVLGQGSAGDQTLGFLQAYEDAGKSLGGATAEEIATKKMDVKLDGTQDIEIVGWYAGGWMSDPAQKAMTDAITALGADGWDGAYVQNNPMVEGAILAVQDAGLNPADYWIGSSNGREISWDWAKEGIISIDVNQAASLEGDALYQQIKAYFNGEDYRKYIHPYLLPYSKDNIKEVESTLIPFSDIEAYMEGRASGKFVTDINDPLFTDMAGYGK